MALAEILTLGVGSAIGKTIVKLWLKDSDIGSAVGAELVDILKKKTSDAIAQRRAQRQFEAIGERAAESLRPLFDDAGIRLDDNQCTTVATKVAETLNQASIDTELLAEQDLEPTRLAERLFASAPDAEKVFSHEEKELYRLCIDEASQRIVDIASQLPQFNENTFAEVLKRENQLIDITNQTLEEVRRIREESQERNPEAEAARFEEAYRLAIVRRLDRLELFGVDASTASRRHKLSVAYITLSVEQQAPDEVEEESALRTRNEPPRNTDNEEEEDEDNTVILPVDEALAGSRRLVVRGAAGSGKTTLLGWIAVRSALRTFEGQLSNWNGSLPFFVRLRQLADRQLPAPEEFPRLITSAITGTMPDQWVHKQLESGRALVLVDGVDEVSEGKRTDVREWLKDLVETYPNAGFIVTSRPYAVTEGWLQQEEFSDAELQPMDLPDIQEFVDHWHEAVGQELQDEDEKEELGPLAEHLKQVLAENRPIRNLATSPLLCAMLCALHRDRRQQLPSDRIELYEACCYLLLERRDLERGVELRDYPKLSYRQKRALLQDFAYWLITNGWSAVERQRADERLDLRLTNMGNMEQDVTGVKVRRLFVERSGVIREPVEGQIDFTHRTFQEFLAAQAALDERDIGVLVKNAHDDQWREVVVLAAGHASIKDRGDLITELIKRGDQDKKLRHQLHLLAVGCLETSVELSPSVKEKVNKRVAKLIPPKNLTEAKALAAAGELALSYLTSPKNKKHNASTAAACVRTLALIGGPKALATLASYAKDTRKIVVKELFRSLDLFPRDDFSQRILSQMRSLYLDERMQVTAFSLLKELSSLTSLNLRGCKQVSDLSPLKDLPNLTSLNLHGCGQVSDLSPLKDLSNLTSLDLGECRKIPDLSPLKDLPNLTSLYLWGCIQVSDLSPLKDLSNLTSLDLYPPVSDLTPLKDLKKLRINGRLNY